MRKGIRFGLNYFSLYFTLFTCLFFILIIIYGIASTSREFSSFELSIYTAIVGYFLMGLIKNLKSKIIWIEKGKIMYRYFWQSDWEIIDPKTIQHVEGEVFWNTAFEMYSNLKIKTNFKEVTFLTPTKNQR